MADSTPKSYHTDPTLYLYTSLTAGSSHIITATSRLETILKANKIPFLALDVATDEKARMLWGRRAGKRKLPGLVRMGMIIGDLEEVEEWNEYGELKENVGSGAPATSTPSMSRTPSKAPPTIETSTPSKMAPQPSQSSLESPLTAAMRQVGLEAAKKASDAKLQASSTTVGQSKASTGTLEKPDKASSTGAPSKEPIPDIAPQGTSTTDNSAADDAPLTTDPLEDPKNKSNITKAGFEDADTIEEKSDIPASKEFKEPEPNPAVVGETDRTKDVSADGEDDEDEDDEDGDDEDEDDEGETEKDEIGKNSEGQELATMAQGTNSKNEDQDPVLAAIKRGKTGGPHLDHRKLNTKDENEEENETDKLPVKKTQDQPAAVGHEAGESVGD